VRTGCRRLPPDPCRVGWVRTIRARLPTIGVFDATDIHKTAADPVRNGNRWHVYAVDTDNHRIAVRRLSDGARAAFTGDYLREHITHGYAITVHSAQGATADTTHAVLGENATRALLYVALTHGRDTSDREEAGFGGALSNQRHRRGGAGARVNGFDAVVVINFFLAGRLSGGWWPWQWLCEVVNGRDTRDASRCS
jgi:hypothetical protein